MKATVFENDPTPLEAVQMIGRIERKSQPKATVHIHPLRWELVEKLLENKKIVIEEYKNLGKTNGK